MEVKIKLSSEEYKELVSYCNLNDLLLSLVVKDSFTTGFNIERYGLLNTNQEKIIEKEVIIEKPIEVIKEIPVEKIVTKIVNNCDEEEINEMISKIKELENRKPEIIEKIIEVPKEVIIEKSSNPDIQDKMMALQNTIQKLKQDNIEKNKKIQELEKIVLELEKFGEDKKVVYLRGSNLDDKFL